MTSALQASSNNIQTLAGSNFVKCAAFFPLYDSQRRELPAHCPVFFIVD